MLLLLVTVVGIPLILVQIILISLAFFLGTISVAQIIGKRILKAAKRANQPMLFEAVVGLAILFLAELVPILGWVVKAVVLMIGFGGAISSKLGFEK
jgi:type III secretory pathway component EscU